jgi:hypothetical protein
VPRASAGEQESIRSQAHDLEDPQLGVQDRRRQLEPHPDGVDRAGPLQQHGLVAIQCRPAEEASSSFATALGHQRLEPESPGAEQGQFAHGP